MIGVGIDNVDIPRFRDVLSRTPELRERLFTDAERTYCERHHDPIPSFAVRFAAKESAMKVLSVGLGAVSFTEIEVVNEASGQPILRVHGEASRIATERGVVSWKLSLSHSCALASATVIAE